MLVVSGRAHGSRPNVGNEADEESQRSGEVNYRRKAEGDRQINTNTPTRTDHTPSKGRKDSQTDKDTREDVINYTGSRRQAFASRRRSRDKPSV
ncbi:hypothetical protein C0Q70_08671 [Pomacea canaliculata]|uniref:Uncharacterized protein n=1 Tax=Pomacea canaliculata TaxID=400727 RepID=A0A2T7P7M3_POMCA|nr:hypothetical protein C0Q70_08671 [Pomacea canaliculata]